MVRCVYCEYFPHFRARQALSWLDPRRTSLRPARSPGTSPLTHGHDSVSQYLTVPRRAETPHANPAPIATRVARRVGAPLPMVMDPPPSDPSLLGLSRRSPISSHSRPPIARRAAVTARRGALTAVQPVAAPESPVRPSARLAARRSPCAHPRESSTSASQATRRWPAAPPTAAA